jgi:NAD(P) transhydrogenase subunit alpha
MGGAADYRIDLEDEVVRGALVVHNGAIAYPPPKPEAPPSPPVQSASQPPVQTAAQPTPKSTQASRINLGFLGMVLAGLVLIGMGTIAPPSFLSHLTVFVLACFVGWQVIWNVAPALHTPLMSVTNAISGIIIVGGMVQISGSLTSSTTILGAIAILIGTINISGGFLVTQRMLKMFQK